MLVDDLSGVQEKYFELRWSMKSEAKEEKNTCCIGASKNPDSSHPGIV